MLPPAPFFLSVQTKIKTSLFARVFAVVACKCLGKCSFGFFCVLLDLSSGYCSLEFERQWLSRRTTRIIIKVRGFFWRYLLRPCHALFIGHKNHRNGIKKPKKFRYPSMRGVGMVVWGIRYFDDRLTWSPMDSLCHILNVLFKVTRSSLLTT